MEFRLDMINTEERGVILETRRNISILGKVSVDDTIGDQEFLRSNDFTFETRSELEPFPSDFTWLALYVNDRLYNIYSWPGKYKEYEVKHPKYLYKAEPIQKKFYDDLSVMAIQYEGSDQEAWNYGVNDAALTIKAINGNQDRYGFSLGLLLEGLLNRSDFQGYKVLALNHEIETPATDIEIPLVFRGDSKPTTDTIENAVNFTFWKDGSTEFNLTWLDTFKLIIFGRNAFVRVSGIMIDGELGIQLDAIPKTKGLSSINPANVRWKERKKILEKYKLEYIKITGHNFTYELGNSAKLLKFEKEVPCADYGIGLTEAPSIYAHRFFLVMAGYEPGQGEWEIAPSYFKNGTNYLVDGFYQDLLDFGNAYQGKVKWNYPTGFDKDLLRVGDKISIGNESVFVTSLRADRNGDASIDAIIVDET